MTPLWFIVFCLSFCVGDIAADHIIRPCSTTDWACVSKFFALNTGCTPVQCPGSGSLFIRHSALPIPHANVTFINRNANVTGLNDAVIKQFYINTHTKKVVLEVQFKAIVLKTKLATIRCHLRGREPVDLTDYFIIVNKKASITIVVPYSNGFDMELGEVYSYIGDSNPSFRLGPGFASSDPALRAMVNKFASRMALSLKEGYIITGPLYLKTFLETNICKFS